MEDDILDIVRAFIEALDFNYVLREIESSLMKLLPEGPTSTQVALNARLDRNEGLYGFISFSKEKLSSINALASHFEKGDERK